MDHFGVEDCEPSHPVCGENSRHLHDTIGMTLIPSPKTSPAVVLAVPPAWTSLDISIHGRRHEPEGFREQVNLKSVPLVDGCYPKNQFSDAFQRLYDEKTNSECWMPKSLFRHVQMPDRLKKW